MIGRLGRDKDEPAILSAISPQRRCFERKAAIFKSQPTQAARHERLLKQKRSCKQAYLFF
jgi:hypothetical protein